MSKLFIATIRKYCTYKRKPKIVRTDSEQDILKVVNELEKYCDVVNLPEFGITENELIKECSDADIILHCYTPITKKVINNAKYLRGIIKYGVGIDAIDIIAAQKRNIPVANIPDYGDVTVAEGAFYLLISLAKNGPKIQRLMNNNGWIWPKLEYQGLDLYGKTIGLIGCGNIGKKFAMMLSGFNMNIICYSPNTSIEELTNLRIKKVELNELCKISDFISIHCTLNPSSKGLIGKNELDLMKNTAYIINTSRGAIIDEKALVQSVLNKKIAGVGLDVYSMEPLQFEGHIMSDILKLDNCIFTPHLAFWTKEAAERLENETLQRCFELLNDEHLLIKSNDQRLISQTNNVRFL